nr:uncharacterized protein LOC128681685 isoform X2 [Plodia interpunctella]
MKKVNLMYFFILDFVLNAYLYPLKVGYVTNFVEKLKPYYYKVVGIFREAKPEYEFKELPPLPYEMTIAKSRRQQISMMQMNQYDKDDYVPDEYMALQKMKKKQPDFLEQEFAPYWPAGDYVYNRTVSDRMVPTTPSLATDDYKHPTFTPVTVNPDCNQDCMRIYDEAGHICGQRWVEKRKKTETYHLFGISWLSLSWLVGWWFSDRDRQDILEFRDFDSLCDLEFENCRNITHNPCK